MCTDYCDLHDIKFNDKKFVCLFFRSSVNKSCALPKIIICDTICEFSNEVKYLGVMISSSMKTTTDVKRQIRTFYARANLLIRNFRHCTDKVKCYLFQSYCTSSIVVSCGLTQQRIVCASCRTSYNTVLRRLLCISLPYSASQMFVSQGILTFDELLRKSVNNFAKRIERSTNAIIFSCLSASIYLYFPIREWWNSLLYLS